MLAILKKDAFRISSIIILSVLICSCGQDKKKQHSDEAAEKNGQTVPEEVFLLHKGSLTTDLQIPGELVSYQKTDIYAKVNSFVKEVLVDVGSKVHKGQLLAVLVAPEISSQISAAYARWKSQQSVYVASREFYNRLLETSKTPGTVAGNDLEQAKAKADADYAQLSAAKASYDEMKVTRSYLTIRAPFDGMITARNINTGAYVGPSGSGDALPMLVLQQQSHMRLVVYIPETYTSLVHIGDDLSFTTGSQQGMTFRGKIARRAGALDTKLRTERIEMDVFANGENKGLLPGMTVEVNMPLPINNSSFVVPGSAIVNSDAGIHLIKVSNHRFVYVPVTLGYSDEKKNQVFGKLNVNDTIVLNASEEQREGDSVPRFIMSARF